MRLAILLVLASCAFAQDLTDLIDFRAALDRQARAAGGGGNTYSNQITINYNRTTGGTSQLNKYGLLISGTITGNASDDLNVGYQAGNINYAMGGVCNSSASCGVGYLMGGVGQPINRGTVHELDGLVGYAVQDMGSPGGPSRANWVKAVRADLVLTAGTVGSASLYGTAHFLVTPGVVTNLYGINLPSITQGVNNWAIKTGLGRHEFGDVIQAQGYKAASGAVGCSGTSCLRVENGLCVECQP